MDRRPTRSPSGSWTLALPRHWLHRLPLALAIALALGWLPYQLFGTSGLSRLIQIRGELARVRADNAELRRKNRALRAELSLYDDDDQGAVERVARDELGLVKQGEVVFRFEVTPR